jgi:hypothetical protein
MALGNCLAADPPEQPFDEYRVKAAFLYNFAKFVQWPSESFQSPTEPFAICVLGQRSFRPFAGRYGSRPGNRGPTLHGAPYIERQTGGRVPHSVYRLHAENKRVAALLAEIKTPGILTVGESESAASAGVIVNFTLEAGKVRFAINAAAAEREKLRISSRLLSLATAVTK